jgi:hypothetical protein
MTPPAVGLSVAPERERVSLNGPTAELTAQHRATIT